MRTIQLRTTAVAAVLALGLCGSGAAVAAAKAPAPAKAAQTAKQAKAAWTKFRDDLPVRNFEIEGGHFGTAHDVAIIALSDGCYEYSTPD